MFVAGLQAGYFLTILTAILFGLFSFIQVVVLFEQLLRYINLQLKGCILGGTSFQSMCHQMFHALAVVIFHDMTHHFGG